MIEIDDLKGIIEMGESVEREFKADRGKFNDYQMTRAVTRARQHVSLACGSVDRVNWRK